MHSNKLVSSVKALAIALQEANCVLPRKDLSPSQEDVLGQLQNGTEQVLEKLRAILDHAQIVTPAKGKRSKINVIWKSVLWDQKEVTDLRNRIALNLDAFNTLLQQVTR
jgi:hypothetical protein